MPAISVIVPVYNKEAYLRESLRSVLTQSWRDLEVILVNDGSTDDSLAIARELAGADDRIRVVDIPNGGVSNARNTALDLAQGEWVQFLDADDLLEADYLERAMQCLREQPVDILFSDFTMVNEHMEPLREVSIRETGIMDQAGLCACFIRHQYTTGFFGYISNKLFRRSLLVRSGARFPVGTTLAEDLDFYARLYPAAEQVCFWNGKSFRYLQTENNYLHNPNIDYYSQLQIHLDIKDWFLKSGQYGAYRDILDGKVAQYAYYILFYDADAGRGVDNAFRWLTRRSDVMACIDPKYMTGFASMVLCCLRAGSLAGIKALFAVRNSARTLYRMVRRHE